MFEKTFRRRNMSNVYDSAYQLEKAIRESQDFLELQKCMDELQADEEAMKQFDLFRSVSTSIQQKQMIGETISEDEMKKAEEHMARAQQNEKIQKLMAQEQRLSMMIGEINQIIFRPLEELYRPK